LLFSQNDKLLSIESGPSCTAELLTRLQEHVETALVKIGPTEVAARLLFSNQPLRGYYRYRDHFQLLPMPPETPQATGLGGDFPFRLEFEFHKSSDSVITSLRMERIARLGASI